MSIQSRRHTRALSAILYCVPLLDELLSSLPVITMPLIRTDLGLAYWQIGLLWTLASAAGLVFDPLINLLSDRRSKRVPVVGGLVGLACAYALIGTAEGYGMLLAGEFIGYVAGTAAVGIAQTALIDADPGNEARTMTRWTTLAAVGDLLAPLAIGAALAWPLGWRTLFWVAAALWLAAGLIALPQRFPAPAAPSEGDDAPFHPLHELRAAVQTPLLLRWLGIAFAASMMDEIFLGFTALFLADRVQVDAAGISLIITAQMAGGLLSLGLLNRLVGRVAPQRLLAWSAVLVLVGVAALLIFRQPVGAAVALAGVGAGAAIWYPLAKGEAYALLPGRSGAVQAVDSLLGIGEVALPLVVGVVAQHYGITAGVGVLGLAPLLVLLLLPARR